jgi:8-oxo-dGTP pyrophosphatase MutT (NUDIX family)
MTDDDYSELYGEPADLVPRGHIELHELGGPRAELSTGLALTWRSRLVFAVAPGAQALGNRGHQEAVAFVGVGGHLDPGEKWGQAVVREALEEANCPISLGDSAVTYLCRPDQIPRPISYRWRETYRPLLVWVADFTLRRGPELQPTPVTLVNAVFRAAALRRPAPGTEVRTLLLLDQDALLRTYEAPRPLGELLARGAEVIGEDLSRDALLAPGGSAYFLAQWLAWQQ